MPVTSHRRFLPRSTSSPRTLGGLHRLGLLGRLPVCARSGLGGAGYHNTLAGPLYALTLYLAVRRGRTGPGNLQLMGLGAALAATIHTNVVFVNFLPLLALHFAVSRWERSGRWPPIVATVAWVGWGALVLTAGLSLANWAVGRTLWFFVPQLELAVFHVADSSLNQAWWKPWGTRWYLQAAYLGPLIGGTCWRPWPWRWPCRPVSWQEASGLRWILEHLAAAHLGTVGVLAIYRPARLDYNYFAYPLVFPLVGALAAFYAAWGPRVLGAGAKTLLLLVVPLSFVLLLAATGLYPWLRYPWVRQPDPLRGHRADSVCRDSDPDALEAGGRGLSVCPGPGCHESRSGGG